MNTAKTGNKRERLKRLLIPALWLAIGIGAIGLRVIYMNQPMRYDEAYTYNNLAAVNLPTVLSDYFQPNNHIFHSFLVYVAVSIFGGAPWVIRLPALVAGLLLVMAQYRVTRLFYGQYAGFVAATLVTFSIPLIEFSVNARGYTLIALFTALLMLEAKKLKDKHEDARWWRYVLWSVLGLYTIPVMLYSVLGVTLWLLLNMWHTAPTNKRIETVFLVGAMLSLVAVLTLLVYTPVFFNTGAGSLFGNEFVSRLDTNTFFTTFPDTLREMINIVHEGFDITIILLLVAGLVIALVQYGSMSNDQSPVLVVMLVVIVGMLLLQQVQPFPRTWLILMPPYFMLASAGVVRLLQGRRWLLPPVIALLAFSAYDNIQSGMIRQSERTGAVPAAADAAAYLTTILTPNDRVLAPVPIDEPIRYYLIRSGHPAMAEQVLNEFRYTREDLLVDGRLYTLAEETTPPEIISLLSLDPTLITLRTDYIDTFGDMTLQEITLLPVRDDTPLFTDDFERANLPGWRVTRINTAVDGDSLQLQTGPEWGVMELQGTERWRDYSLAIEVQILEQNPDYEAFYVNIRHSDTGRYTGTLNAQEEQAGIAWEEGDVLQGFLEQVTLPPSADDTYELELTAQGEELTLTINGRQLMTVNDQRINSGGVRLAIPPLTRVRVSSLQVEAAVQEEVSYSIGRNSPATKDAINQARL